MDKFDYKRAICIGDKQILGQTLDYRALKRHDGQLDTIGMNSAASQSLQNADGRIGFKFDLKADEDLQKNLSSPWSKLKFLPSFFNRPNREKDKNLDIYSSDSSDVTWTNDGKFGKFLSNIRGKPVDFDTTSRDSDDTLVSVSQRITIDPFLNNDASDKNFVRGSDKDNTFDITPAKDNTSVFDRNIKHGRFLVQPTKEKVMNFDTDIDTSGESKDKPLVKAVNTVMKGTLMSSKKQQIVYLETFPQFILRMLSM